MAKKFDIKNVSMVFLPFVPAHIEYFKSGKHYLGKMKDGEWYIFYHDCELSKGITHERCVKYTKLNIAEDGTIETIEGLDD